MIRQALEYDLRPDLCRRCKENDRSHRQERMVSLTAALTFWLCGLAVVLLEGTLALAVAIGLAAGILFRKGLLNRDRLSLSVFGGLSIFVIYGGILNPTSGWMYQSQPNLKMVLATFVTGLPADAVHAASTVFFLWILSESMLQKLDRVKVKYGLIE